MGKVLLVLVGRILLMLVAIGLTVVLGSIAFFISFIYYTLTFKWKTGLDMFSKYVYQIALSVDQLDNVALQSPLNLLMVKRSKVFHPFGDEDDTMSYCIAMNRKKDTLSKFGKFWAWFLDFVDRADGGHLYKTLKMKDIRDKEACDRLNK